MLRNPSCHSSKVLNLLNLFFCISQDNKLRSENTKCITMATSKHKHKKIHTYVVLTSNCRGTRISARRSNFLVCFSAVNFGNILRPEFCLFLKFACKAFFVFENQTFFYWNNKENFLQKHEETKL